MKCDECLPRIEEYVDGELDGRTMERVAAHLLTCAPCASELAELKRDAEIYASYRRDIDVTPAQWNIVRARIEQEKDARAPEPSKRFGERFVGAIGSAWKLRPAFVAALILIAAALFYLSAERQQQNLAAKPPKQSETPPLIGAPDKLVLAENNQNKQPSAGDVNPAQHNPSRRVNTVARNGATIPQRKEKAALARAPRPDNGRIKQVVPDNSAESHLDVADNSITGVLPRASMATGNFDMAVARHAEKTELLLRSFRNVRRPVNARSLDVSYEKENARRLLYRNIALRRDAARRGDESTAALLNKLEPILLDIANLPGRAKSGDVRSIEQRMEKKEIVATLQVRTLVAAN